MVILTYILIKHFSASEKSFDMGIDSFNVNFFVLSFNALFNNSAVCVK